MQHRHERAIDTQHEAVWAIWNHRPIALDPLDLGELHRFVGHANRFGQPLGGRFAYRNLSKTGQHLCCVGKRHPRAEMGQVILEEWRELTRQQCQFLIEGEKALFYRLGTNHSCGGG